MPPRLAKLLALVVAVALVAGAFWYRGRGDGGGGSGDGDGGRNGTVRVACISELADVCRTTFDGDGFEVTVADAAETATALQESTGEPPFDAWVTLDPWPAMVDVGRSTEQQPPLFEDRSVRVASSPLATLAQPGLRDDAGAWERLASRAANGANVGVPAHDTALGAVVEGQAAVGLVGSPDFGNEVFPEVVPVLKTVLASAPRLSSAELLRQMVVQQGSYDTVTGPSFLVERTARTSEAQRRQLVSVATAPVVRAVVVVATVAGTDQADRVTELLTGETGVKALKESGWTVPADKGPTGLPAPDVLVALREEIE